MGKLWAVLDLFRKGNAVADKALWKDRAGLTLALTAIILAAGKVLRGFGYDLPLSESDAATLAAGIAVLVGLFSTYGTSDKVGILPAKPELPADLQPEPVSAHLERTPAANAVDQHQRDYPRDPGGGS